MKVQPSALVSHMSGSIANLTIQTSKAGLIARSRPSTIGRVTHNRRIARSRLANAVHAWRSLTPDQRHTWSNAAPPTNRYTLSGPITATQGYTFFLAQYLLEMAYYGQWSPTPPTGAVPRRLENIEITIGDTPQILTISFVPTPLIGSEALLIQMSQFQSATSSVRQAKNIFTAPLFGMQTSPITIPIEPTPGSPIFNNGLAVGFRCAIFDYTTASLSRPIDCRTVVTSNP